MHTRIRGILLIETVIGLSLIGALILGLVTVTSQYANAARVMKGQRIAYRCAEGVLSELQAGGPASIQRQDMQIELYAARTPQTPPPDGFVWTVVNVEYRRSRVRLVGLVPQRALTETLGQRTETKR